MRLEISEDDPRRTSVRSWLAEHATPSGRELAEAGYVAPHWPAPWGLDADPIHQLIVDDELARANIRRPTNPIGIGWAGPTILHAGTGEQKARYLLPLLSGEEYWCQLFSEPGSGSDLASLSTHTVRDGDEWIVNGQKVWTSGAKHAQFGILIARTNPDVSKHKGITYFICPMDLPGIEIRPIREMTGGQTFNEVFFTDVRIPHANVVGDVNDGWRLAKVTLGNERVSLSTGGVLWGFGPTAMDVLEEVRSGGGCADPVMRQRLAKVYTEHVLLELIRERTLAARVRGDQPGPEASVRKILADEHGQHVVGLARDLTGAAAMIADQSGGSLSSPSWYYAFLFAPALTIGGGTGEVQRNIIGERALGLPREPSVTSN
ncbi:MAG: acyl-CoA dehydrogenase family protein [Ilumatobacteraceae bacterium]